MEEKEICSSILEFFHENFLQLALRLRVDDVDDEDDDVVVDVDDVRAVKYLFKSVD